MYHTITKTLRQNLMPPKAYHIQVWHIPCQYLSQNKTSKQNHSYNSNDNVPFKNHAFFVSQDVADHFIFQCCGTHFICQSRLKPIRTMGKRWKSTIVFAQERHFKWMELWNICNDIVRHTLVSSISLALAHGNVNHDCCPKQSWLAYPKEKAKEHQAIQFPCSLCRYQAKQYCLLLFNFLWRCQNMLPHGQYSTWHIPSL